MTDIVTETVAVSAAPPVDPPAMAERAVKLLAGMLGPSEPVTTAQALMEQVSGFLKRAPANEP